MDGKSLKRSGERGRNRTYNLLIKSQLLCQLSYAPTTGTSSGRQTKIIASANDSATNGSEIQIRDFNDAAGNVTLVETNLDSYLCVELFS